jgi:outer membrane protein insertion porin family
MKKLTVLSFLLLFFVAAFSQGYKVTSIHFEGQKRTQRTTLERLVQHPLAKPFDNQTVNDDLRRLKSFEPIISALYRLDTINQEAIQLVYIVEEGISRYPLLFFGGLSGNVWWEAGYTDRNWQGRGEILALTLRQTDGRMGGSLHFQKPFFRGSKWGAGLQIQRYASREPLYFGDEQVDYFYLNHSLGGQVFYNFRPEDRLEAGASFFREDFEKVNPEQIPGPTEKQEFKQLFRLAYQLNKVNFDWVQPEGYHLTFSTEMVTQREQVSIFYLVRAIGRHYKPIGKAGLLATRVSLGYAANENTPFAPFVVDSRINIRGAGNRVDRGTAAAVLNTEYRQQLLSKSWLILQGVAFMDIGTWRNPGGNISDLIQGEEIKYFTGLGIRAIIPKAQQAILRLDYGYGVQPLGQQGIVLGLGQYF